MYLTELVANQLMSPINFNVINGKINNNNINNRNTDNLNKISNHMESINGNANSIRSSISIDSSKVRNYNKQKKKKFKLRFLFN